MINGSRKRRYTKKKAERKQGRRESNESGQLDDAEESLLLEDSHLSEHDEDDDHLANI